MTKIDLGSHRARCAYSPFGNRSPTIIRWERGYPRVVETDYHIIHGMAVALLLNRDADHNARLACRALVPKQMREVIGDDRVFVGETRTACQLGGGRFCLSVSVKAPRPTNRFYGLVIVWREQDGAGL